MAKILVADDEQLIRKLIGDCLKKEGHTVLEAEDGKKEITLATRHWRGLNSCSILEPRRKNGFEP